MLYRVEYVISDGEDDRFIVEIVLDDEIFLAIEGPDADKNQRTWMYPRSDGEPWALTLGEMNALVETACRKLRPWR